MADGDMLPTTGDCYAAQLGDYLIADDGFGGADWWITELDGFGDQDVKTQDMPYALAHGSKATVDLLDTMGIVFTLRCDAGTAGAGELAFKALGEAWFPTSTDVDLHLWVPGRGHCKVTGRPRPVKGTRLFMAKGVWLAVATFEATDPEIVEL